MYRKPAFHLLHSIMISIALMQTPPLFAVESSLPAEPQEKSRATESVQADVDKESADRAA